MKYTHIFISLISILIFACGENSSKNSLKQTKKEILVQKLGKKDTIPLAIVEKYTKRLVVTFDINQLEDSILIRNINRDGHGYYSSFALDIHGRYIFLFDGFKLHKIEIASKKILVSKKINTSIPIKKLFATTLRSKEGVGILFFSKKDETEEQRKNPVKLLVFDNNLIQIKELFAYNPLISSSGEKALDGILAAHSLQMNKSKKTIFFQKGWSYIDTFENGKYIYSYQTPQTGHTAFLDIFTSKIYDYNGKNKSIDYQGISVYDETKYYPINISNPICIFDNQIFFNSKKTGNLCFYNIESKAFVETSFKNGTAMTHFMGGTYYHRIHRIKGGNLIKIAYYDAPSL